MCQLNQYNYIPTARVDIYIAEENALSDDVPPAPRKHCLEGRSPSRAREIHRMSINYDVVDLNIFNIVNVRKEKTR